MTTGELNILNSTIGDFIIEIYKDVKFTNTVFMITRLGGGILLHKNNESLVIYGDRVCIKDKWYKASKDMDLIILDEIKKQINKL